MTSNTDKHSSLLAGVAGWAAKAMPWVAGIAIFMAVCYIFYAPQFEGKSLGLGDITQYGGMSQDIRDHREATGEDPQWTGNMFSGMPAYLIDVEYPMQDVKQTVGAIVKMVDGPMNMTLFAMVMMMVAVVLMGVNPWIGIVAGLAYGLSTYFFLIIDAGHITKMWALVYAPPLVASVWYALRKDIWIGAALAALFGSLELGANHPQITYYFLLVCLALWCSELWFAIRERALGCFFKRTAILGLAALLALGSNFSPLWYTMRHQRYTTRGVAEAVVDAEQARNEKIDYNTAWSYGITESGNMLVPNYMGAWSGEMSEEAVAVLRSNGVQEAIFNEAVNDLTAILREQMPEISRRDVEYMLNMGDEFIVDEFYNLYEARFGEASAYVSAYWGEQPYTAGPTYLGAAAILLAILGAMLLSARNRWWVIVSSFFALLLAWGANVMGFYELMFDMLPGYKNFRTVSMALVVVQWSVPLFAVLALRELLCSSLAKRELIKRIVIAVVVTLLAIVAMLLLADYGLKDINEVLGEALWVDQLKEAAYNTRYSAAIGDALRSTLYVVVTALLLVLLLTIRERAKGGERNVMMWVVVAAVGVVMTLDLVGVDKRYINASKWVKQNPMELAPSEADLVIMADKDLGYRVLDLSVDPFNSARASYFHRSVGGYHGAKLGRYQEVIDCYLAKLDPELLAALNTRYVIYDGRAVPLAEAVGAEPYGAAWFIEGVVACDSAAEELEALGSVDLQSVAVVSAGAEVDDSGYDTSGSIVLTEYAPNYLQYEYESSGEAFAVFSEIYFADGWTAYIDGQEAEYVAADYILRGMELPAGKHTVEWRFRAPQWGLASTIMGVASWVIILAFVAAVIYAVMRRRANGEQIKTQN